MTAGPLYATQATEQGYAPARTPVDADALARIAGELAAAGLARPLLRSLHRDLTDQIRRNGGGASTQLVMLLSALRYAIDGSTASGTRPAETVTLKSGTLAGTEETEEIAISTAASRIGCTASYVRRLARSGKLAARRHGRDWLITWPPVWTDRSSSDRHGNARGDDR